MSTTTTPNRAGMFVCKLCGRGFTRKQGLGRHMSETHGTPTTRESRAKGAKRQRKAASAQAIVKPEANGSANGSIREQLRQLAQPLTEQRDEIDRRLAALAAEAQQLRVDRSDIDAVLKRLDPSTQQTTAKLQGGNKVRMERQQSERVAVLRDYTERHADKLREGFTATQLVEAIKAEGGLAMTTTTALRAIDELRESGIVRADRVTRGGGMRYQLVTNGGTTNG
jgi:DNA-binding transcriptional ArsR family regulator